jgi:hypothetical protein
MAGGSRRKTNTRSLPNTGCVRVSGATAQQVWRSKLQCLCSHLYLVPVPSSSHPSQMKNGPSTRFSLCPPWWAEWSGIDGRGAASLSPPAWLVLHLLLPCFLCFLRTLGNDDQYYCKVVSSRCWGSVAEANELQWEWEQERDTLGDTESTSDSIYPSPVTCSSGTIYSGRLKNLL